MLICSGLPKLQWDFFVLKLKPFCKLIYNSVIFLQNAKVMSWWDYGYQITAMANRTILVDNNTWNNTHISRVGQVSKLANLVLFLS